MSVFFCDSSAVVKCYVAETGSSWMDSLIDPASGNAIYIVRVLGVEVISAITRRANRGAISATDAVQARQGALQDFASSFQIIEVTPALVTRAISLVETYKLRGYDAVQLAAAIEIKDRMLALGLPAPTFVSADNALNTAAAFEGLLIENPNNH